VKASSKSHLKISFLEDLEDNRTSAFEAERPPASPVAEDNPDLSRGKSTFTRIFIWNRGFLYGTADFYMEPRIFIWNRGFLYGTADFYMEQLIMFGELQDRGFIYTDKNIENNY
jgi:hypothetical protein